MSKIIKDKSISLRLPGDTVEQLDLVAQVENKDRTEIIRDAIDFYLGRGEDVEVKVEKLELDVKELQETIKILKDQLHQHQTLINKCFLEL